MIRFGLNSLIFITDWLDTITSRKLFSNFYAANKNRNSWKTQNGHPETDGDYAEKLKHDANNYAEKLYRRLTIIFMDEFCIFHLIKAGKPLEKKCTPCNEGEKASVLKFEKKM